MTTITLDRDTGRTHETITSASFGGNFLFDIYDTGVNSPAVFAIENAGITNLRYPGGGVTEEVFDLKSPDNTSGRKADGTVVTINTPMDEFFEFSGANGNSVTIVVPIDAFIIPNAQRAQDVTATDLRPWANYTEKDLRAFINKCLNYAEANNVEITHFELGNEFWGLDDRTPRERTLDYGVQAAYAAQIIDNVLDNQIGNASDRPDIIAQLGADVRVAKDEDPVLDMRESNELILEEFQKIPGALAAVDGVVTHRYQNGTTEDFNPAIGQALFNSWKIALRDIGIDASDFSMHWTEWNTKGENDSVEYGLRGASNIVEMLYQATSFQHSKINVVDSMNIWPIANLDVKTSLIVEIDGKVTLSATGKAFQMMSETLIGARPVDIAMPENTNILLSAYEQQGDKLIVFVSNRSDTNKNFDLALGDLTAGYHHVWAKSLDIVGNGARNDRNTPTVMEGISSSGLFLDSDPNIDLTLAPYEVMRLEFTIAQHGVIMNGDNLAFYDDILHGSAYNDTIRGFGGADELRGAAGNDNLNGGSGNDRIFGGAGNDFLAGSTGNDTLDGGTGADTLNGGAGNDLYFIDNAGDVIVETTSGGDDTIRASINIDLNGRDGAYLKTEHINLTGSKDSGAWGNSLDNRLSGNSGNNKLDGRGGNDRISGNAGNDSLWGGAGNDTLDGGTGTDIMTGGAGADIFVFRNIMDSPLGGSNRDTITDFGNGADKIHLHDIDANTSVGGNQSFSFSGTQAQAHSVWYVQSTGNTLVRGDNDGDGNHDFVIELRGVTSLTEDDFIF